jgi:hypothetical protein
MPDEFNLPRSIGLRLEVSMRRKFGQLLLAGCLLVIPAMAQRGGGGHGGGGGFHGGMGGGFRGGGWRGGGWRGGGWNGGWRGGWWGNRGGTAFIGGWGWPGSGWGGPGWGWGYPYSYGGYYGGYPYGSYPYSAYPNYDTGYANVAGQLASCPQVNGAPLYQIKLTYQNNIYLAQKYWYTPGTLNFITAQGEEKKTPINTIDPVTFQLNQSCSLNFTVPQ